MKIIANIISKGTERQGGGSGYMAITERLHGRRFIMPISHDVFEVCESEIDSSCLKVKKDISLSTLTVCRFQLIPGLFFSKHNLNKNGKIVVVGMGGVGFAILLELERLGYKNVSFYSSKQLKQFSDKVRYNSIEEAVKNNDYIIEATGEEMVVKTILSAMLPFSTLILFGTPRTDPSAGLLGIHRKNIAVVGAHEITGYSFAYRQKIFDRIINYYSSNPNILFDGLVEKISYSKQIQFDKLKNIFALMVKTND